MAKAVFSRSESSRYDDDQWGRYHFPRTYFAQATAALGDWVVYYEPRRNNGPSSSAGRQGYFAMARLAQIEPDATLPDHFYADVFEYIPFDRPVPFREGTHYYESGLMKPDGTTSKGAFGRSVRQISDQEFAAIVAAGFTQDLANEEVEESEPESAKPEPVKESVDRQIFTQILQRKYRDAAFRRRVRAAYDNTCAITGWRLLDGGGLPEVEAAHIRPVEENGPDTVQNGIALTATFHWMFDHGLIAFDETLHVMVSSHGLPHGVQTLIPTDRRFRVPSQRDLRPHPIFLAWHRAHRFKP
jgi:putative restriction endonuclease